MIVLSVKHLVWESLCMSTVALTSALDSITADRLLEHITILASDQFEGRAPGTEGEKLTLDYLTGVCRELKLEPVGDGGSYLQSMPVTGLSMTGQADFSCGAKTVNLKTVDQVVVRSQWWQEQISIDA